MLEITLLGKVLCCWYIFINVVMFFSMGRDKSLAKHEKGRRIPEANLFVKALIGGGPLGLVGMKVFHHKTRKASFYIIYWLGVIIHVVLVFFLIKNGYFFK